MLKTKKIKKLEKKLGVKFKNQALLTQALVHRSYLNEANEANLQSNERLEFLGDVILSFVISQWLFERFPEYSEGNLTNLRSNLVKTEALAKISKKFDLGNYLFLSKGEKEAGGQKNPSLLANGLEALIGALYLDQGLEKVRKLVKTHFRSRLTQLVRSGEFKDAKSLLQEKLQAQFKQAPHYQVLKAEGPDHAKIFTVAVYHQKKLLATGQGKSKQAAEEKAAALALEKIKL